MRRFPSTAGPNARFFVREALEKGTFWKELQEDRSRAPHVLRRERAVSEAQAGTFCWTREHVRGEQEEEEEEYTLYSLTRERAASARAYCPNEVTFACCPC